MVRVGQYGVPKWIKGVKVRTRNRNAIETKQLGDENGTKGK